ncbi:MAG: choice-of-anchor J domain-containing protein [Bacteroidales bacterium]|nr:choice-of-anchor J domain-containing protein [Bacteroidales bacterium]
MTTFPWTESFEGSLDCWSVIDADGDGNVWGRTTSSPYEGSYALYSFSYDNDNEVALNAENYLVSPQITLPATGTYQLVFYARCANDNYPDSLWVKLSTTGNTNASAFNTILMQKTVVPAAYQQYTINLSDYNGQSFYLAFVHDSYDGYYLLLDNVSIVNSSMSYTITATSANTAMGTVTGGGTYTSGAEVVLVATANAGYRFTGWGDGNTVNPYSFSATANASYTAYFADLGTEELHYDNGTLANSMGAGGTLYWAVRFPADVLSSYTTLSSVRLWDLYAGSYHVSVCQGGTNAPGALLASQTFSLNGTGTWFEATFSSPLTIDPTQALWIVLYNTGVDYPAAASTYAGNPDGSWVSLNGNDWNSICSYGYDLTWMVRPVLSSGSTPQTYTITAVSANTSMGDVIGGGSYPAGTTVQLMANAYQGYEFVNWQDGNTSNPRIITVTGNATYTANFQSTAVPNYTITATSANNAMGTVTGGGTYPADTTVQLVANPAANHHFVSWNDGNTSNPRYITVTENATYIATFAIDQYQIDVLSSDDAMGTVTGGGLCNYGSVVQIQAYPSAGYEFVYWNDGNTDNPRDITVTGNATYVANFQPTVGIDDNNLSAVSVYSHDHQIVVCHAEGECIEIYDVLGKRIAYDAMNTREMRQFTISTKGVYLVRVGDSYFKKVIVK